MQTSFVRNRDNRATRFRPSPTPIAQPEPAAKLPIPRQVGVIINPIVSRATEAAGELLRQTAAAGIEREEYLTTRKSPGEQQTKDALANGADLIVVIGGDGTVRRVAGALAGSDVPLAVLPAGSGNVLARNLGLSPNELDMAVAHALAAPALPVDLGWAKLTTAEQNDDQDAARPSAQEPFMVMAGIGRDAQTVASTRAFLKRRWGWGAYAESGIRHALAGTLPMTVQFDDANQREIDTWTLLAGLVPYVPAGIRVFPQARINDGKLHALEVPIENALQWAAIAARGMGNPAPKAKLRYTEADHVVVTPQDRLPVQLDGDIFTDVTRLELSVQAAALRLRIPAERLTHNWV